MKNLTISEEFKIQRLGHIIKLIKPTYANDSDLSSVADIFKLPINAIFLRKDSIIVQANDQTVMTNVSKPIGTAEKKDLLGKSLRGLINKESAEKIIQNDRTILMSRKMHVFEEVVSRLDDINFTAISFKYPCYDINNELIGILCLAILTDDNTFMFRHSFISALESMIYSGLFSTTTSIARIKNFLPGREICGVYLSAQETKCLHFLIRGRTVKMTAQALKLSPRTVENYLQTIKYKLNASTKAELICKVIDSFLPSEQ
jgi:DNA-binding CsgD family transcriptional regulator